ncbi:MAG: hypothetical protein GQ540_03980 [Lutibacter sp.]|uniref:hypothetical protein n=1 Tax=Lutibacter sp. TaxID=1925666 RepID=UPI0019E3E3C5|nr:hypothetical protein [Lutibacter sp.]NOR27673.1 hypothetical protein [Lutibacter sp.]
MKKIYWGNKMSEEIMKLENWSIIKKGATHIANNYLNPDSIIGSKIKGQVYGNDKFDKGESIFTGKVKDFKNGTVFTDYGKYKLGKVNGTYASRYPEAKKML